MTGEPSASIPPASLVQRASAGGMTGGRRGGSRIPVLPAMLSIGGLVWSSAIPTSAEQAEFFNGAADRINSQNNQILPQTGQQTSIAPAVSGKPRWSMRPEHKRIKIAEACGWKSPTHPETVEKTKDWQSAPRRWLNPSGIPEFAHDMPDYLNNLNAMHNAEKVLNNDQLETYTFWLSHICALGTFTRATAEERADAFLATISVDSTDQNNRTVASAADGDQ